MEEKINVAEILKDKPQGTKLYSSACGKCKLEEVDDKSFKISFYNSKSGFMVGGEGYLDKNGKLYDDGECVVFPSKEMRDWSKFAWKKGDVLVDKDNSHIIFEKFSNDTYTTFIGKLYYQATRAGYSYAHTRNIVVTQDFEIEKGDAAQTYIKTIEERLGGKLNRETLEVEKAQPEFKDGDVVCISGMGYLAYGIVKSIDNSSNKLEYYALNDMSTLKTDDWLSFEDKQIQPITETQQIILFDALAKKGMIWDVEKKKIMDLKPKVELKPFDKVVARDGEDLVWFADLFSHIDKENNRFACVGNLWNVCLPYNEETAKLIGTTNNVEG